MSHPRRSVPQPGTVASLAPLPGSSQFAVVSSSIRITIPAGATQSGVSSYFVHSPSQLVVRLDDDDDAAVAEAKAVAALQRQKDYFGSAYAGDALVIANQRYIYTIESHEVKVMTLTEMKTQALLHLPLGLLNVAYAGMPANASDSNCVVNLVWNTLHACDGFKLAYGSDQRGKQLIRRQLAAIGANLSVGVSITHLKAWCERHGKGRVGLLFVDPAGDTFFRWPDQGSVRVRIAGRIGDAHVHALMDSDMKRSLAQAGRQFQHSLAFQLGDLGASQCHEVDTLGQSAISLAAAAVAADKPRVLLYSTDPAAPLLDLEPIAVACQARTNVFVVPKYHSQRMTAFRAFRSNDPDDWFDVVMMADLVTVKRICQALTAAPTLPNWPFEFRAQTLASVATSFFRFAVGSWPKSRCSPRLRSLLAKFPMGPLTASVMPETDYDASSPLLVGVDVSKAYSSVLLDNDTEDLRQAKTLCTSGQK